METSIATAQKHGGLGNQQPSRFHHGLSTDMMMRWVQRLAERRRAKRPEKRGLHVPAARPIQERLAEKVEKQPDGCYNWTGWIAPNGYGQIHASGKTAYVHQIAWKLANARPIPKGAFVLHTCDNRRCVNPDHLWLGSYLDNIADMNRKMRHAYGEKNGHAKLTVEQVKEIRAAQELQIDLSRKYGVAQGIISMIRARKIWKYV